MADEPSTWDKIKAAAAATVVAAGVGYATGEQTAELATGEEIETEYSQVADGIQDIAEEYASQEEQREEEGGELEESNVDGEMQVGDGPDPDPPSDELSMSGEGSAEFLDTLEVSAEGGEEPMQPENTDAEGGIR